MHSADEQGGASSRAREVFDAPMTDAVLGRAWELE
jgi:hypothetical protein